MTATYDPLDYATHPTPRPGYRWDRWAEMEVRIEYPINTDDEPAEDNGDWNDTKRMLSRPNV